MVVRFCRGSPQGDCGRVQNRIEIIGLSVLFRIRLERRERAAIHRKVWLKTLAVCLISS